MLDAIDKLPVTGEEREAIRWGNAARLLGLEERIRRAAVPTAAGQS